MTDNAALEKEIRALLVADEDLSAAIDGRIWVNITPNFDALPSALIALLRGSSYDQPLSGDGGILEARYEITVIGKNNDIGGSKPIADRIDALMAGRIIETADFYARIFKQSAVEMPSVLSGTTRFSQLGATYRVILSVKG